MTVSTKTIKAKKPVKAPREVIEINKTPLRSFSFNQISNHNFIMALLDKNNQFMHSPFMCKDYFQDMFWAEFNNKTASVYGLGWNPGFIDMTCKTYRMAFFGGGVLLAPNAINLEKLLNFFDDAQGFDRCKVFLTPDPEAIVVEFDARWTTSCPLLSALTTVIRISGPYKGEGVVKFLDKMEDIRKKGLEDSVTPKFSIVEIGRLHTNYPRLLAVLSGKKITLKWTDITTGFNAHCTGIMGWDKFPEVDSIE